MSDVRALLGHYCSGSQPQAHELPLSCPRHSSGTQTAMLGTPGHSTGWAAPAVPHPWSCDHQVSAGGSGFRSLPDAGRWMLVVMPGEAEGCCASPAPQLLPLLLWFAVVC